MNAFDVDYWIGVMCGCSRTPRTLDEKSRHSQEIKTGKPQIISLIRSLQVTFGK